MTRPFPPYRLFKAEAYRCVSDHADHWDSPATFGTLHWYPPGHRDAPAGGALAPGTWASIQSDVHPQQYAALLATFAEERLRAYPDDPPCAFLFAAEVHTGPPPDLHASKREQAEFRRQLAEGRLHERPGNVEKAVAFVADIRGRVWHAECARGREDIITQHHYDPGEAPYWPELQALIAVAQWCGVVAWEIPLVIPARPR